MKVCTKCGEVLNDGATSCYNCGYSSFAKKTSKSNSDKKKKSKGNAGNVFVGALSKYAKYSAQNWKGLKTEGNLTYSFIILVLFSFLLTATSSIYLKIGFRSFLLVFLYVIVTTILFILMAFVISKYLLQGKKSILDIIHSYTSFLILPKAITFVFLILGFIFKGAMFYVFMVLLLFTIVASICTVFDLYDRQYYAVIIVTLFSYFMLYSVVMRMLSSIF